MDHWEVAFREKSVRRAHQRDYRMIAVYLVMGAVALAFICAIIVGANALID
jgi:hypothetical protein